MSTHDCFADSHLSKMAEVDQLTFRVPEGLRSFVVEASIYQCKMCKTARLVVVMADFPGQIGVRVSKLIPLEVTE